MKIPCLRRIYIDITSKCNAKCKHCYYRKQNLQMDIKQFKRILTEFLTEREKATILLLGGEPTLHPQLNKFITLAKSKEWSVGIITNGLTTKYDVLEKADEVQVSIDHYGEKEDEFRNVKGCFKKQIKTLENLENSFMRTTIKQDNIEDIKKLIEVCVELNRDWVGVIIKPLNKYSAMKIPTLSQIIELQEYLKKINAKYDISAYIDHPFYFNFDNYWREKFIRRGYYCPAGWLHCSIKINGDVTPCLFMDKPVVGNAFKDSFGKIRWGLINFAEEKNNHLPICEVESQNFQF